MPPEELVLIGLDEPGIEKRIGKTLPEFLETDFVGRQICESGIRKNNLRTTFHSSFNVGSL